MLNPVEIKMRNALRLKNKQRCIGLNIRNQINSLQQQYLLDGIGLDNRTLFWTAFVMVLVVSSIIYYFH